MLGVHLSHLERGNSPKLFPAYFNSLVFHSYQGPKHQCLWRGEGCFGGTNAPDEFGTP